MLLNKGKTKVMATDGNVLDIRADGEMLEQVDSFAYLGAIITANGDCGADIKARIGLAKNVLSRLTVIWNNNSITKSTKMRLLRALVWPVATYGAEAWTYRKEGWKRWLAFETTGYRRAMRIPWEAKQTNDEVLRKAGGRQLYLVCW